MGTYRVGSSHSNTNLSNHLGMDKEIDYWRDLLGWKHKYSLVETMEDYVGIRARFLSNLYESSPAFLKWY